MFLKIITNERKEHIKALRKSIVEFCHLVTHQPMWPNKRINKLKYEIVLRLDPSCKEWDGEIIRLVEKITKERGNNSDDIKRLVYISQFHLKLEWTGMRIEGEKGVQSDMEKKELLKRILKQRRDYEKRNGI